MLLLPTSSSSVPVGLIKEEALILNSYLYPTRSMHHRKLTILSMLGGHHLTIDRIVSMESTIK